MRGRHGRHGADLGCGCGCGFGCELAMVQETEIGAEDVGSRPGESVARLMNRCGSNRLCKQSIGLRQKQRVMSDV